MNSAIIDQQNRDKKLIDTSLNTLKIYISSGKLEECPPIISRINPPVRRLGYRVYEFCILCSMYKIKVKSWDEARVYANEASLMKSDDPIPWRMLVQIESESNSSSLSKIITRSLESSLPDANLAKLIAPHLIGFDSEKLTSLFLRYLETVPNWSTLNISGFLPISSITLPYRLQMLKNSANNDTNACSDLIHILINEGNPFDSIQYASMLPEDHIDRVYVDALFGNDPLGKARIHVRMGMDTFRDFVESVDRNDLKAVYNAICHVIPFLSGWVYYIKKLDNNEGKLSALLEALSRFQGNIQLLVLLANVKDSIHDIPGSILTIEEIVKQDRMIGIPLLIKAYIKNGDAQKAEKLLTEADDSLITMKDRCNIDMLMWQMDKDPARLYRIIKLPSLPGVTIEKAKAAWELRFEIGDKTQDYFIEAMKVDKNDPTGYFLMGKWIAETGGEQEKAIFLFIKAYERGLQDPATYDAISRHLIDKGEYDQALAICKRSSNEWSHFRAALILQRMGEHYEACEEFQKDLRINPSRIASWRSLGHSYLVLGRAMASSSVAEELRKRGCPDLDLEYQLKEIYSIPIDPCVNSIEALVDDSSPMKFSSYLKQSIRFILQYKRQNRINTCFHIINKCLPFIEQYALKWESLVSVIKICADFYLEAFCISKNPEFAQKSQQYYMKRAEMERRAESFIDLSQILHFQNDEISAIKVLRKALRAFPEHYGLWLHLGIAFSFSKQYPFSRHCLCVAAKIATSTEIARAYSCVAGIGLEIGDEELLEKSLLAARSHNPYDPDVWTLLINRPGSSKYESSRIAYEFGASEEVIQNLSLYCLQNNKPLEALGYALMTNDEEIISSSFEANNNYVAALALTKDSSKQIRIKSILEAQENKDDYSIFNFSDINEAKAHYLNCNSIYSKIAYVSCLISEKNYEDASKEILHILEDSCQFAEKLEEILLRVAPKTLPIDPTKLSRTPMNLFLYHRRMTTVLEAATITLKKFPTNIYTMKLYIFCVIKFEHEAEYENAKTILKRLIEHNADTDSIILELFIHLKTANTSSAINSIQILCYTHPKLIKILIPVLKKIRESNDKQ